MLQWPLIDKSLPLNSDFDPSLFFLLTSSSSVIVTLLETVVAHARLCNMCPIIVYNLARVYITQSE